MVVKIGLLGLQGDYARHSRILSCLDLKPVLVRYQQQLEEVNGLIIPGGESTTMTKLIASTGLRQPLLDFARKMPVLGTCAGLILMSNQKNNAKIDQLGLLDIRLERNAYGRQVDSFSDSISVDFDNRSDVIAATFIRAPKIIEVGSNVEILARHNNQPVAIRQGRHIGLTFHPELDDITLFHQAAFYNDQVG